jgi:hypothetical protein
MFDQFFGGLLRCGHGSPRMVPAFRTFNKKALIVRAARLDPEKFTKRRKGAPIPTAYPPFLSLRAPDISWR